RPIRTQYSPPAPASAAPGTAFRSSATTVPRWSARCAARFHSRAAGPCSPASSEPSGRVCPARRRPCSRCSYWPPIGMLPRLLLVNNTRRRDKGSKKSGAIEESDIMRAHMRAPMLCFVAAVACAFAQARAPRTNETATPPVPPRKREAVRPLTADDLTAFVDGMLPVQLDRSDIAGAVVAVIRDNDVLLRKGYGYADVEKKTPVDPAVTGFRPGSISKLFTWISVM